MARLNRIVRKTPSLGRKVPSDVREGIDNRLYDAAGDEWWDPDSAFHQTLSFLNPVRVGFIKRAVLEGIPLNPRGKNALEVGCGGGILCEEIARLGFETTGIDPSGPSLRAAAGHARAVGLDIRYAPGSGESIPFPGGAFDAVFCCDVLEHVRDLALVISEISRVLKPGGAFCYDTFNLTWTSKLAAIKIGQEWKRWAFMPPRIHVFGMFIKPGEMKSLLRRGGLEWRANEGTKLNVSPFEALRLLRLRARGELSYRELGERIRLVEGGSLAVVYQGCAVKI